MSDAMAGVLRTLGESLFVFDPLEEGPASWLTRGELVARLKALPPINDPHAVFNAVLSAEDELKLREIVEALVAQSERGLRSGDFAQTAAALLSMGRLDRLGSAVTARLVAQALRRFDATVGDMERSVQQLAMQGRFDHAFGGVADLKRLLIELAAFPRDMFDAQQLHERVAACEANLEQRATETKEMARLEDLVKEHAQQVKDAEARRRKLELELQAAEARHQEALRQLAELRASKAQIEATLEREKRSLREGYAAEIETLRAQATVAGDGGDEKTALEARVAELQEELSRKLEASEREAAQKQTVYDLLLAEQQATLAGKAKAEQELRLRFDSEEQVLSRA
jgi:hypothetical protein